MPVSSRWQSWGAKPLPGWYSLVVKVQHDPGDQAVVFFIPIYRKAGGLVGNEQELILIDHLCREGAAQKSGALRVHQAQLGIRDEKPDHIAGLYPGGKGLLFAVQLDLVFPQGLVQPAHRKHRVLFHQIFIQPDGQKAVYSELFHFTKSKSFSIKI